MTTPDALSKKTKEAPRTGSRFGRLKAALANVVIPPTAEEKAAEIQSRPLEPGTPAARIQQALTERGKDRTIVAAGFGKQVGVEVDVLQSALGYKDAGAIMLIGNVASPGPGDSHVSKLSMSRETMITDSATGTVSDRIIFTIRSEGNYDLSKSAIKSQAAREDTFTLTADAAGVFSRVKQTSRGRSHAEGYQLPIMHELTTGYTQEEMNANFAAALDTMDTIMAMADEQRPQHT